MKEVLSLLAGLLLFVISSLYAQSSIKAIVGGTLISPNAARPLERAVILVKDSRIIQVGTSKKIQIPKEAEIINAEGKWIMPGLIDAHVHFFQSGGLYTRPDVMDLRKYVPYQEKELAQIRERLPDTFARYLRCGITSVVDVGGPFWNFEVRALSQKTALAPRVAVAGPLISTYQPEALTTDDPPIIKVNSVEEAQALVQRQAEKKTDLIKIWFIVLPNQKLEDHLPLVKTTIEESHKLGIRVAVHATELETARAAVKAGAKILVHSVIDKEVDEEFIKLLKDNEAIYTTTLAVFEGYNEVFTQQVKLTPSEHEIANPYVVSTLFDIRKLPTESIPPMIREGIKNPKPISTNPIALKNLKRLQDAGVTIAAGTDAGNIGTLHGPALFREFELMAESGLSPMQILKAATLNGARVMGQARDLGAIEAGKLADMLILNSDPLEKIGNTSDIHLIIKDGKVFEPKQIIKKAPEEVVQQQVNAYNARDLQAFLATYSPEIKIYNHPDSLLSSGLEKMQEAYKPLFDNVPSLHCEIVNRIVLGGFVIDQEKVTGLPNGQTTNGIALYKVQDGVIQRVWFIPE